MDETISLDLTAIFKWGSGEWREGVNFFFFWGESANAVPNSHKLCSRVPHIWGNRRLQLPLSAMRESRPGGTALLITISSEPGKYAYASFGNVFYSSLHLRLSFVTFLWRLDDSYFPISWWHLQYKKPQKQLFFHFTQMFIYSKNQFWTAYLQIWESKPGNHIMLMR